MAETTVDSLAPGPAAPVAAERSSLAPLRLRDQLVFSTGDAVLGLKDTAVGAFLLFYLTAVCGMPGTLAGFALFLSLMIDAFADPFIGYLSDSTRSRFGRRHPYMVLSAVPHLIAFGLLFSAPALASGWGLFAYVLAVLVVLRLAHSFFSLPYAALSAEISRDYRERSMLGAFRSFTYFVGVLAAVVLGYNVYMGGEGGLLDRRAYAAFGWTCAALALAVMVVCAFGTWRLRHRMHHVVQTQRPDLRGFGREMGDVIRSRSFLILFFTILVFWTSQGAHASLTLHAYKYFWELPASAMSIIPISGSMGLATGIPVAMLLLARFEKGPVCNGALAVFCVLQFTPVTLRMMGVLTEPGPLLYGVLNTAALLSGWTMACVTISFGAMMADTADEHELLFGSRREALYFSGLIFSVKAAVGIGAFLGGVMLDVIGFPRNIADLGPNPTLPEGLVTNLGLIYGPGAAVISAAAVLILVGYRIDARRHAAIMEELAQRKAAAGA